MVQGTTTFYNGVLMRDCKTESFRQSLLVDEANNSIGSKFEIKVSSLIFGYWESESGNLGHESQYRAHPSTVENTRDGGAESTAIDRLIKIQRRLSEPRKDFFYAMTGGKKEDRNEDIYQILVAATGVEPTAGQLYFKGVFGEDIEIRYADKFHPAPLTNELNPAPQKILRERCFDVKNGPTTKDVEITEIFGGKAFRVSVTFEIHRTMCEEVVTASSSKPSWVEDEMGIESNSKVLSNSWSVEETLDETWRRTKTIEGTLRTRGNRTIADWAQNFRHLVLPALLPGYRRKSMRFVTDPTNLVLKYRVEDEQAEAAPPIGCIDWKMTHTDSALNEYGQIRRQLEIQLIGAPRANRLHLVGMTLGLLNARFPEASQPNSNFAQIHPRNGYYRNALVVVTRTEAPVVDLVCDITITKKEPSSFSEALLASTADLSIAGYNPDVWPAPRPFDAQDPVGVFGCYFQSPCSPWHGMIKNMQLEAANNLPFTLPESYRSDYWNGDNYPDYQIYESPVDLSAYDRPVYTVPAHNLFPYTFVDIDNTYELDHGKMVLPLSAPRNIAPEGQKPVWTTVCVIPIHAQIMHRILRVNCTRHGRPPELPWPEPVLTDPNGVLEELVDRTPMVLEAAPLAPDGANRIFSAQMKLKYVLNRPLTVSEKYQMPNNPSLVTAPGNNFVPGGAIFSKNRIGYHEVPSTPLGNGDHSMYSPVDPNAQIGPGNEVGSGYDSQAGRRSSGANLPNYPYIEYPGKQGT
jgi:hypothetical protein